MPTITVTTPTVSQTRSDQPINLPPTASEHVPPDPSPGQLVGPGVVHTVGVSTSQHERDPVGLCALQGRRATLMAGDVSGVGCSQH